MALISENLNNARETLRAAAHASGRDSDGVELLAVSKTFPVEVIEEAAVAGQVLFGESRVQEAVAKIPLLPSRLRWHFIGRLQKNKIRKVLPLVEAVHSIESLDLALAVERVAGELGLFPRVYLQVNLAGEASKFGFSPIELKAEFEPLLELERLEIAGLMAIPPFLPEAEEVRPYFAELRELRDELEEQAGIPLPGLSMGMSHDFPVAIEEGATIVRVGSALFGQRPKTRTE